MLLPLFSFDRLLDPLRQHEGFIELMKVLDTERESYRRLHADLSVSG